MPPSSSLDLVTSEISLGRAIEILKIQVQQDIPTLLLGPPGIGKSAIINALVQSMCTEDVVYHVVDLRLGQMDVPDLRGLPILKGEQTLETRPHWFPQEGATIDINVGTDEEPSLKTVPLKPILFLDEITSAVPVMQAAAYQLVLERKIGQWSLPKGTRVVAAGNRLEDNAVVFSMSSALRSRLSILNVKLDYTAWDAWAIRNDIDPRVLAYLRHKPEMLADYDQLSNQSYPCPRSWDMLSQSLRGVPHDTTDETIDTLSVIAASVVGAGASLDFSTYIKTWQDMPDIDALLSGRVAWEPGDDIGLLFAVCTAVSMRAHPRYKGKYVEAIFKFANNLPSRCAEFRIRVGKDAISMNREVFAMVFKGQNKPEVARWFQETGSKIHLVDAA